MSRKIKFRIWDRASGRFVMDSSSLHCRSNWHIGAFDGLAHDFVESLDAVDEKSEFVSDWGGDGCYLNGLEVIKQQRYIVQQFTGIKDITGQEVYEGDFVEISRGIEDKGRIIETERGGTFPVVWDDNQACFRLDKFAPHNRLMDWNLQIVGNILESPESHDESKRTTPLEDVCASCGKGGGDCICNSNKPNAFLVQERLSLPEKQELNPETIEYFVKVFNELNSKVVSLKKENADLESKLRVANFPTVQATHCGRCGKYAHTPWKDDEFGYVCANCVFEIAGKN